MVWGQGQQARLSRYRQGCQIGLWWGWCLVSRGGCWEASSPGQVGLLQAAPPVLLSRRRDSASAPRSPRCAPRQVTRPFRGEMSSGASCKALLVQSTGGPGPQHLAPPFSPETAAPPRMWTCSRTQTVSSDGQMDSLFQCLDKNSHTGAMSVPEPAQAATPPP